MLGLIPYVAVVIMGLLDLLIALSGIKEMRSNLTKCISTFVTNFFAAVLRHFNQQQCYFHSRLLDLPIKGNSSVKIRENGTLIQPMQQWWVVTVLRFSCFVPSHLFLISTLRTERKFQILEKISVFVCYYHQQSAVREVAMRIIFSHDLEISP